MLARRTRQAIVLLLVAAPAVAGSSLFAWSAWAEGASSPQASASSRPAAKPAGREYADACSDGNTKYLAHDYRGAIEAYQKAIDLHPNLPLAYYLQGEAQVAAGGLSDAEVAWTRALAAVGDADPALRSRILFVLADLKERQGKWEEARGAWQQYRDWVSAARGANGFAGTAQARQQAIDAILKLDKDSAVVRQRIADTKDGGVFTDPSKSPPPRATPSPAPTL